MQALVFTKTIDMLSSSTKLTIISLVGILSLSSCASNQSFNQYYKQNKKHSDIAFSFPKWAAMVAIPAEEKEEVRYFTEGMNRVRVLVDGEDDGVHMESFVSYADEDEYSTYLVARKDGNDIGVMAKEDGDYIREIVLSLNTDDAAMVVGILGKMHKKTFFGALDKAKNADLD